MHVEIWHMLLNESIELVHAEAQLGHARLEHLSHTVILHNLDKNSEAFLFWHLHQQQPDDKGSALAVTNLPIRINLKEIVR